MSVVLCDISFYQTQTQPLSEIKLCDWLIAVSGELACKQECHSMFYAFRFCQASCIRLKNRCKELENVEQSYASCEADMWFKMMDYSRHFLFMLRPALHRNTYKTHYKSLSGIAKIFISTNVFRCCMRIHQLPSSQPVNERENILAAPLTLSHSPNKSTCISLHPKPNFRRHLS